MRSSCGGEAKAINDDDVRGTPDHPSTRAASTELCRNTLGRRSKMLRPNTLVVASMMRVVASTAWRQSGSKLPHLANRGLPCEPNPPIRQSRLTSTGIPAVLAAFTAVCMARAMVEAASACSRALTLTAPPCGYRLIRCALRSLRVLSFPPDRRPPLRPGALARGRLPCACADW